MSREKILCTLGKFDIPIIQMQPPFVVDLLESNIILFGLSQSGKTNFLKTFINILHKRYNESQEQIFILDFGGALSEYQNMPLVAAYFDNSNEEYVKRVFKIMDNILKDNIKTLNGGNYRKAKENQPIHTTLVIDNINAFIDESRYTAYQEKLAKICRDGLSRGITVVVTAGETKGLNNYLGSFRQKIALEMPADKYMDIFNGKVDAIGNYPGHGFANVTVKQEGIAGTFRMNLPYEVQCFKAQSINETERDDKVVPFQLNLRKKFRYNFDTHDYERHVKKYLTFPKELSVEDYERLKQTPIGGEKSGLCVSVGLDYVDFCPVTVNLAKTPVIAIYGKKEFGKTNLLNLLIDGLVKQKKDVNIVLFDDGRNQLSEIYDKYKENVTCVLFNKYEKKDLALKDGKFVTRKITPLQQFYLHLNENYIELDKKFLARIYGLNETVRSDYDKIPDYTIEQKPFTVFVIQSKLVYLNALENKRFINFILPQLVAVAEEREFLFIFSDTQKLSEDEQTSLFNNSISTAFLLDNVAEFAGERGQKTIFGTMDTKALKEDYARCELGDGYCYDVEADKLVKLKFIKHGKD